MMLKEKSNPWGKLMYLLMLPVGALVLSAFARPEISERFDEISKTEINDLSSIIERKIVNSDSNVTKQKQQYLQLSGPVNIVMHTGPATLVDLPEEESANNKMEQKPQGLEPVVQTGNSHQVKGNPLVIIDGHEVSYDKFLEMQPIPTESFHFLRAEAAESLYGERGKNGVYVYGTKPKKIDWDVIGNDNPIIIIDDEVVPFEEYLAMQPIKARSMEFISPEEAVKDRGPRAKNGIYKYTTKPVPYIVNTLQINGIPFEARGRKPFSVDMRLVNNIQVTDSTIVLNIYEDKSPQPNLIIKGNNLLIRKGSGMYINLPQNENMENHPLLYKDKFITLEEFNKIQDLDFYVRFADPERLPEKYGDAAKNGVLLITTWEDGYDYIDNKLVYVKREK